MRKSAAVAGPAIVFKQNGTQFPLVGGVYNSNAKALIAYGCTEENVFDEIVARLSTRIPPTYVDDGPVHENVILGDDIDLSILPVPRYSPDDGGPYITPGFVVSHDPETGVPDIGHYRCEIIDNKTMSLMAAPSHRFAKNQAKAKLMGQKTFRASLVIGVDPMIAYSCPIQVPEDTNDWEVVGGMRGEAVELVKCRTNDVSVPAHAEVVIEFEVDFTQTVSEGPLGEYTGYYTPASPKPVVRPTAITHRNGAYFQALLTGRPTTENHILKQLSFEASFYDMFRQQFPTVTAVAIPPSGGVYFRLVVAMRAALFRRGPQRDPRGDGQQPATEDGGRCRPRHRRARLGTGRVGDGLPHPACARRDHRGRPARRTARPDGRRVVASGSAHRIGDRHRRHLPLWHGDQASGRPLRACVGGARRPGRRGGRRAGLARVRLPRTRREVGEGHAADRP